MLVLTRREGEAIAVGDCGTIRVLSVRGRSVRLGIEAPGRLVTRIERDGRAVGPPEVPKPKGGRA